NNSNFRLTQRCLQLHAKVVIFPDHDPATPAAATGQLRVYVQPSHSTDAFGGLDDGHRSTNQQPVNRAQIFTVAVLGRRQTRASDRLGGPSALSAGWSRPPTHRRCTCWYSGSSCRSASAPIRSADAVACCNRTKLAVREHPVRRDPTW